jgi:probable O-glycosylation ligase (exosortase A-associated)
MLGRGAGAVVLALGSRRKLAATLVIVAGVAAGIAFMPEKWSDRASTIQTYEQDESAAGRLVLWGISLKLALDRPLVGSGFMGPYTREVVDRVDPEGPARAVHSIWFELLGEHGVPTFVVWVGLTLAGAYYAARLRRLTRDRPDLAWAGDLGRMAQASIAAYLVAGSFLSLSYWDFYWTLLVVVGASHALVARAAVHTGHERARVGGIRSTGVPQDLALGWRGRAARLSVGGAAGGGAPWHSGLGAGDPGLGR